LPFIHKSFHVNTKQKAFLFLIRQMGFDFKIAQSFISKGRLFCNGIVMNKAGGEIEGDCSLIVFSPITKGLNPIFTTDEFALFDKPSGLLVHPQNRHTPYSLTDEIKHHFSEDANLVHRIDQETSGLVLASRNKKSEIALKGLFENRLMQKEYIALVRGKLEKDLLINEPLLRKNDSSGIVKIMVKVHSDGKPSSTYIKPIKYFPNSDTTLISAYPRTGRQHQIRVHLFHVKHPIVGDPLYSMSEHLAIKFLDKELSIEERIKFSGAHRLMLHAKSLSFNYGNNFFIESKYNFEKECKETNVSRETR